MLSPSAHGTLDFVGFLKWLLRELGCKRFRYSSVVVLRYVGYRHYKIITITNSCDLPSPAVIVIFERDYLRQTSTNSVSGFFGDQQQVT